MAINIFLGAPGTGKGTISNELKAKGFKHFSTGDMFRYNMKNETPLGLQVKAIIDAGNLVEDELTFEMLKDALMRDADLTNDSIILDGYPRTINQANLLNDWLAEQGLEVYSVVNFEAPREVILARLTGRRMCPNGCKSYHMVFMPPQTEGKCDVCGEDLYQRGDDMESSVVIRMEAYDKQTLPLTNHYADLGELKSVNADQEIPQIVEDTMELVK